MDADGGRRGRRSGRVRPNAARAAAGLLLWWLGWSREGAALLARPWPRGLGPRAAALLLTGGRRRGQRAAHVAFAPLGWESERVLWIAWACGAAPFGRLTADLMRHIAAELRPLYPPNIRQICGAQRVPR
jgi:hypothetical protein